MTNNSIAMTQEELEQRTFIAKVYGWMTLALIVTAYVAMFTVAFPTSQARNISVTIASKPSR